MRVLDIDLDFFLSSVMTSANDEGGRLPADEYQPWTAESVRAFLEKQLGLDPARKIPAILCVHHDEVLYHCEELIGRHHLVKPFDLVHVDAHADMGTGDNGWVEILERATVSETLKKSLTTAYCERIGVGNYISYMVLFRMLSSLTYVHNPASKNDVLAWFLNKEETQMRIPVLPKDEGKFDDAMWGLYLGLHKNLYCLESGASREKALPFSRVSGVSYTTRDLFDLAFLAQSPGFTPAESDQLIKVFGEYLDFEKGEPELQGPRFASARALMSRILS